MSEFKFACPVCGQHLKCDSSQGGLVMDCPTCFQKITIPHAPTSADQKIILASKKTQIGEKPATAFEGTAPGQTAPAPAPVKSPVLMVVAVVMVILTLLACVAFFFLAKKLLHPGYPWQSADVGAVGQPGAFFQKGDTLVISGSGSDIWDKADAFHYVYLPAQGDVSLTVQVDDLHNTDPWAKAGIMIRESLAPDSAFAEVMLTPKYGVGFQQRTGTGVNASPISLQRQLHAPYWLRLNRQGNTFTADTSADGNQWTSAGSTTIPMRPETCVGLIVCSHANSVLNVSHFDHATFTAKLGGITSTPPPVADVSAAPAPVAPISEPIPAPPASPKPAAHPANDGHWKLNLAKSSIPDSPATGRVHGQNFEPDHAAFQGGILTLRNGSKGPMDLGVTLNFSGAQAEELASKTINVTTSTEKAARASLHWKDDAGAAQKTSFDSGYAMRLQFGALAGNHLPGKIYLCLPDDEKSYVLGSFTVTISKPKPKPKQNTP